MLRCVVVKPVYNRSSGVAGTEARAATIHKFLTETMQDSDCMLVTVAVVSYAEGTVETVPLWYITQCTEENSVDNLRAVLDDALHRLHEMLSR